jgi:multiple sugar transport system substrate-binding protein
MIRILIVEDMILLQESLANIINGQEDMEVSGVTANADEALALCRELNPDLVLVDVVTANKVNGIEAAANIRLEMPDVKVVIMTALPEISFIDAARKAGAHSFVYKDSASQHMLYVIRRTMEGKGMYPGPGAADIARVSFSDEEIAVIRLVCQGKTLNEITKTLFVTEDRITELISGILNNTGFDSITKFSIYAVANGFVVPDDNILIEQISHTAIEENAVKNNVPEADGFINDQHKNYEVQNRKSTMKKLLCAFFLIGGLIYFLAFHGDTWSRKKNIDLMIWHTYVEQMGDTFDVLVQEFNETVGAKEGIIVRVAVDAHASSLNEMLIASVKHDPGALACPDIALVYPNIAVELARLGALVDLRTLFKSNELDRFVPQFLEEGMLGGDTLYILPLAKSTEVLFVNRTIFDRFARDVGIDISQLATFEGILNAAEKYYEWTDAKTPDIPGDGKTFYYPDTPFNYAMIGFEQLGDSFVKDGSLNLSSPTFRRIWDSYFPHAVRGSVTIFDNYSGYLARTGDIVCATGTSAGAVFYPQTVIYADNTKEDVTFDILPFPVFEGGERVVVLRGGGMCILKSDAEKERAAALFLKWLTDPAQNLRFTASTGYMPVTNEAFDLLPTYEFEGIENEYVRSALKTIVSMWGNYRFHIPPVFDGFDELQRKYVTMLISTAKDARREYERLQETTPLEAFDFEEKIQIFIRDF